ncbi:hypothetical protein V3851_07305 [Paenibacillus sp. M1]|uniref:Butirosin biosynthesis protein H N-terminal domain-containing protein n=1 Tax=Paenibacillus haidiansis TaxID=1574488 RepID=A0ABU7VPI1_9BACL
MQKILPYAEPIVKGYQNIAFPLSVSLLNENFMPWFYSNFIQIRCRTDGFPNRELRLNFYGHTNYYKYPNLEVNTISKDLYSILSNSVIEFVIQCIDLGFYVKTNWDEYYIPERFYYLKEHFDHDVLVYGYDRTEKVFYTQGYNKYGQYGVYKAPFDVFEQGYAAGGQHTVCFRNKKNWSAPFNLDNVKSLLRQYLNAEDTSQIQNDYENNDRQYTYGMGVYHFIDNYLENLLPRRLAFDRRVLYSLWEHKACMVSRLKYMSELGYTEDEQSFQYEEIEKKTRTLLNMFLKAGLLAGTNLSEAKRLIKNVRVGIQYISEFEQHFFEKLLASLSSQNSQASYVNKRLHR